VSATERSRWMHCFCSLLKTSYFPIFLIALACWVTYLNSLSVPFYLDDVGSIANNKSFDDASFTSLFHRYKLRYLGYVSLWVNYEYAKLDVTSYHAVNVAIHMLNGIFVYLLALTLTAIVGSWSTKRQRVLFASFVGLVFVLHPLQSQGVTYIVQRLASQVTLFYLATVTFYLLYRTASSGSSKLAFFVVALLCAVAACFTKQNAFTLPLILLLSEWVLFKTIHRKHVVWVAIIFICCLVLVGFFPDTESNLLRAIDGRTRATNDIARLDYFLAQIPILWNYIGKIIWPWPLQLEYDYTINTFDTWVIIASGMGHLVALVSAILVRKSLPLVTWGVLFYYLTHIIESGVVPIPDLAFEHRTYLPNVGLYMAIVFMGLTVASKVTKTNPEFKEALCIVSVALLLLLGLLTIARNQQWLNPEAFLANDMVQAPKSARAIHNYAEYKFKQGDVETALTLLDKLYVLEIERIDVNMLNTHISALINAKRYNEALNRGRSLLDLPLKSNARVMISYKVGIVYTNLMQYEKAEPFFAMAYEQDSLPVSGLIAYAYTSFVLGNYQRSTQLCKKILTVEPQHRRAKLLLSLIREKVTN